MTHLLEADPEGISWTARIPFPYTLTDANTMLDRVLASPHSMAIEVNGEFAGGIGLRPSEDDPDALEIGYWVGRPFRGKGIAGQAVTWMLDRARAVKARRVIAIVFPGNEPSVRLLQAHGFRQTGEYDLDLPLRGGVRHVLKFTLDLS
jgi:RimJ/RimL family protein N-acetyltransferase